jgi:hypothetical protein
MLSGDERDRKSRASRILEGIPRLEKRKAGVMVVPLTTETQKTQRLIRPLGATQRHPGPAPWRSKGGSPLDEP